MLWKEIYIAAFGAVMRSHQQQGSSPVLEMHLCFACFVAGEILDVLAYLFCRHLR